MNLHQVQAHRAAVHGGAGRLPACRLDHYPQLNATGVARAQWKFDASDWRLEEDGLIMEKPTFPLTPGDGPAFREGLPQAGLHGTDRRGAAGHSPAAAQCGPAANFQVLGGKFETASREQRFP